MCADRSADESRQLAVDAMGDTLGRFYHALWNELAWLYLKWGEYLVLFGTKPSRIDLINRAAGEFFRIVQDSLWDDTLLHIARLVDSPRSAGKDTLSFRGLPNLIADLDRRHAVQVSVDQALAKSEFARDWRNRRIAHKDLRLALADGAEPLKPASRAAVREALCALADVLNTVSNMYLNSTTAFEGLGARRGAETLLYVLDDGLNADQQRRERQRKGEYRADDYAPRDL